MATKIREKVAALAAIVIVIILFAVGSAVFGWDVPILSNITDALGIGGG